MPATLKRKKETKTLAEQLAENAAVKTPALRQEYELAAKAVSEDVELSLEQVTQLKIVLEELDITAQQFDADVRQLRNLELTEQELAKLDRTALEAKCSEASARWKKWPSRDNALAVRKASAERQVYSSFSIGAQQIKHSFRHLFSVEAN